MYFTKGSQKKVRHHLEWSHINSKMCSVITEDNRSKIQPVPEHFRHFAHFVTRYCASDPASYANTSEEDSNQRQKHWTAQVLVSRPKQPKSRIIVNPLRPNVFYHILSSVSLLMYKLLSCRVNIEYMSCLILQTLLMDPHSDDPIPSHVLFKRQPNVETTMCSSKNNQM